MRFSTDFSTPYLQYLNTEPMDLAPSLGSVNFASNLDKVIPTSDSRNINPEAGIISQIFRV